MMHKVLLRFPATGSNSCCSVNINDAIGLGAFSDYSLDEYIADRASEGVPVIERSDDRLVFADGESGRYEVADMPAPEFKVWKNYLQVLVMVTGTFLGGRAIRPTLTLADAADHAVKSASRKVLPQCQDQWAQ